MEKTSLREKETSTLVKKMVNSGLGKIAVGATTGLYLLATAGCASLTENYTINGQRFDRQYAESGQIVSDASPEQKKWYQTKKGKAAIVLGTALLGWGVYEALDDDDSDDDEPVGDTGGGDI